MPAADPQRLVDERVGRTHARIAVSLRSLARSRDRLDSALNALARSAGASLRSRAEASDERLLAAREGAAAMREQDEIDREVRLTLKDAARPA